MFDVARLASRTHGVFQVVTTGVGKLASPKFPSISERRDLGFLVSKAIIYFLGSLMYKIPMTALMGH